MTSCVFAIISILFAISCGSNTSEKSNNVPRTIEGITLSETKDSVLGRLKQLGYKYEFLSPNHIYIDLENSSNANGISLNLYFVDNMCFGISYQPTKSKPDFDIMANNLKSQYPMQDEHKGIGENGDNVLYSYRDSTTILKLRTDYGAICYYDIKLDSINQIRHPEQY